MKDLNDALKTIESAKLYDYSRAWKNAHQTIKKILAERRRPPLTEACENIPVQINLNDPSLPLITKQNEKIRQALEGYRPFRPNRFSLGIH